MPTYEEIYEHMIDTQVKKAQADMAKNDHDIWRMMAALAGMRERLLDTPSLTGEAKEQLTEFFTVAGLLTDAEHRYLYLQGARDFASLLREFDVIK